MIRSIKNLFDSALLTRLSSKTKKVCLVIVDYAALSTDPDDILLLVKYVLIPYSFIDKHALTLTDAISHRNYKSLEYIVVDRFQDVEKYEVYLRNYILKTPEQLTSFDFRPKLPHLSI